MFKRLLALLLALLTLSLPAVAEENDSEHLSDEEITSLLWDMYQTENGDADFMVLPDDYQEPAMGKRGIYNLLLIGVDNPGNQLTGRSDTMLLASFNARSAELKLVSFMRDTYVAIPKHGHNKLNAAYAYGGAELLIQTLELSFGVKIDGYLAVNYALMTELVDDIGGIEMTVSEDERKKLNGIIDYYNRQRGVERETGLLLEAGTQRLTGLQTMAYARIRKLDSDFVRVQRQQKVILAIYDQVVSLDLGTLTRVAAENIGSVGTNVTLAQAASLIASVVSAGEVKSESLRIPADGAYASKMLNETYYIVPRLERCQEALREFLYE